MLKLSDRLFPIFFQVDTNTPSAGTKDTHPTIGRTETKGQTADNGVCGIFSCSATIANCIRVRCLACLDIYMYINDTLHCSYVLRMIVKLAYSLTSKATSKIGPLGKKEVYLTNSLAVLPFSYEPYNKVGT